MRDRLPATLALLALLIAGATPPRPSPAQDRSAAPPKKILVELFTSQGCNSCPPASDLLARLATLGYGPDRVVAVNFHVDYFNTPWVDPFSDPSFSDREQSYNRVMRRNDLYFTPLMMVDGRYPFLGSNREQAVAAIRKAKAEAPGVALDLALDGDGPRRSVAVRLAARAAEAAGRDLLIGVALTQNRVSTRVPSGENAGRTLAETHVVRRLDHQFARLDRAAPTTLTFPVALPAGLDPADCRVVAFAQDRANGRVHQAEAIPWATPPAPAPAASRQP